jgi:hypothetical protein
MCEVTPLPGVPGNTSTSERIVKRAGSGPVASTAAGLLSSLRCLNCGHFHRFSSCTFPRCDCGPRDRRRAVTTGRGDE